MSTTTTIDIDTLRLELKIWEKNFSDENGGRKPTRAEIKANPSISAKYSLYSKLCRPAPASTPSKRPRPRPEAPPPASTPRKSPSNTTLFPSKASPEPEPEPTPAFIRSALGPTPQKDGHVLGIFDLLSSGGTPSKPTPNQSHDPNDTIAATPSKPSLSSTSANISRTPQSSSKRFYLETFAGTPLTLKRKREANDLELSGSPSTARKLQDATPSFLRRSTFPLSTLEDANPCFSSGLFKRPPIRKSLSSVIRGMRQKEEQRMQDDWDVLDELEAEARGEVPPPRSAVQVEDSQQADMPLGPDQGAPSSEDEETAPLGRDGLPRKAWKKKGLKRQTRRVKMKPVLHKPGKEGGLEDVEEESGEDVVAETQDRDGKVRVAKMRKMGEEAGEDAVGGGDSGSDYGAGKDEDEEEDDAMPASPSKVRKVAKPAAAVVKPAKEVPAKPDNILKKAGKKVAATAHANFRRLNIKNKNSKAKGRGGRFGKR